MGGRVGGEEVGLGVRVDVNEELKFFLKKITKKIWGSGGVRVGVFGLGVREGVGSGGGVGLVGGQGGCERNVEGRG